MTTIRGNVPSVLPFNGKHHLLAWVNTGTRYVPEYVPLHQAGLLPKERAAEESKSKTLAKSSVRGVKLLCSYSLIGPYGFSFPGRLLKR
jgi:hypothetical protein